MFAYSQHAPTYAHRVKGRREEQQQDPYHALSLVILKLISITRKAVRPFPHVTLVARSTTK